MEEKLFQKQSERPMHVAAFGSGSGTILSNILAAQKTQRFSFVIKLLFTDKECNFQNIAHRENLPLIYHPRPPSLSREEYDQQGLEKILQFSVQNNCPIDLILLAGYMRLMSTVWLHAFPYRIVNMHPADLTVLDGSGKRKFIGANAVHAALQEGEKKTRSCAILIDETVDGGPILVSGPWVHYHGSHPVAPEDAVRHQTQQKTESDIPSCLVALELIGQGRVAIDRKRCVLFVDTQQLPPCGYTEMNAAISAKETQTLSCTRSLL